MAPLLGYWDIRGLAEPIRFLLNHVGVNFTDKRYEIRPHPRDKIDRSEWLKDKSSLDIPFPNLPYYIDGNVKLSQSLAILRYLARKHGLDAKSEEEKERLDLLEQVSQDLFMKLIFGVALSTEFEKSKGEYLKTLPDQLKPLSTFLAGKKWFLGDRVTYVDFLMYERLDYIQVLESSSLDDYANIKAFMGRIESLPNIKKYMESGRYKPWPLFSPMVNWGY